MGFVIFMTVSDNEAPKQVIVIDETGRMLYPLTQLNATRYLPIKADQSIEQIRISHHGRRTRWICFL